MSSAPLAWSDRLLLGFPEMDADHRELVERIQALQSAEPADVAHCLAAFAEHARRHFDTEDRWMRETEFPPRDCHMDEHAAVLKSVAEVQALVAAGNAAAVPSLAAALADWFPGHADHLDSALAAWMSKRRWGARPLVLRRDLKNTAEQTP